MGLYKGAVIGVRQGGCNWGYTGGAVIGVRILCCDDQWDRNWYKTDYPVLLIHPRAVRPDVFSQFRIFDAAFWKKRKTIDMLNHQLQKIR